MKRSLLRRRLLGTLTSVGFVLAANAVIADPSTMPAMSSASIPIAGTVDGSDIASCSLVPSRGSQGFTPVVVFTPPAPTSATTVYFTLYDASGKPLATQAVVVPAPPAIGLPQPLAPFVPPSGFSTAHCDTKPPTGAAAPPSPPAAGPNTGLILGVVGGAGLLGIALGGHGGSGSSGSSPTSTPFTPSPSPTPTIAPTATPTIAPTATPTIAPTATPTIAPTATPTIAPTATPTIAPTASPTIAPTATPTIAPTATPTIAPTATPTIAPTRPTATPTIAPTATPTIAPTATPTASPGTLVLKPSTLNFYSAGSAYNQSTTASQSAYTGSFSVIAMTCSSSVATISQSGATFTVTPVAAGPTCTFTIAGGNNMSASLTVNVTTSSGTINAKHPAPSVAPNPKPGKSPR